MKRKSVIVLLFVLCLAVALFTACGEPAHTHTYTTTTIAPTCTEQGYTTYTCSCGDTYKDNYVNALGHNYVNGVCTRCKLVKPLENTEIRFATFNFSENKATGIVNNQTQSFDFKNEIEVASGATWHVCADEYGQNEFLSKKVPLEIGDNTFCIFVSNGNEMVTYNVTIRRKPMYSVQYFSQYYPIPQAQSVEEGTIIENPGKPTKAHLGYKFVEWDFDFSQPITSNVTINAIEENLLPDFNFTSTETTCTITGVKDKSVTEVVIPDYVTSIGEEAFSDCSSLTSVTIGNNVTSIGYCAFSGCSGLTSITISDSVTSIGPWSFKNCSKLTKVNYTGDINSWVQIEFDVDDDNPLYYAHNLYINDKLVTEANITTATKISVRAFSGCSSLTSVTISDSVTSIDGYVFSGCSGLTSIQIPDSVTSIGYCAFSGCSDLSSVVIPDSVTSIRDYVFSGCSGLTSIQIPDSVTSLGSHAFSNCSSLASVEIPDSVMSIGEFAFSKCSSLASITIPDSVTSIGASAFSGCSSLETVYWNATNCTFVESYSYAIFSDCSNLKTVVIGDNVQTIPSNAFCGCSGLTSITIGSGVTSIGLDAFYDCSGLMQGYYTGDINSWAQIEFGNYAANPLYYVRTFYINNALYKTTLAFPDSNSANNKMGSYSATWTAKNAEYEFTIACFNNNRWESNWSYIKCGSKNKPTIATISTDSFVTEAVKSIVVKLDEVGYVNSFKLYIASDADFTADLQTIELTARTGDNQFVIPQPATGCYYKIEFNMARTPNNGAVVLSQISFYG